jgi:hypothetical protein
MGLLVAGITGGASLIDATRITSAKRELDDYVRDAFTFYSRVGRFPGDLQNSGVFGDKSGHTYSNTSFPHPYNVENIKAEVAPFIELYLYEISSFKPNPSKVNTDDVSDDKVPFLKTYKDYILMYRTNPGISGVTTDYYRYGMDNIPSVELRYYAGIFNIKMRDVVKKIDTKFDDGAYNGGNIRAYCKKDGTNNGYISYDDAIGGCLELMFYFNKP